MNSRRQFLIQAPVALLGAVAACHAEEQKTGVGSTTLATPTPGAPPAFNTAPPVPEGKPHQMPAWLAAIFRTILYVAGTLLVIFLLRRLYRMLRNVKLPVAATNDADDWERVKVDKLSDAVDANADGIIQPNERVYAAGTYADNDFAVEYRQRLVRSAPDHPFGANADV